METVTEEKDAFSMSNEEKMKFMQECQVPQGKGLITGIRWIPYNLMPNSSMTWER